MNLTDRIYVAVHVVLTLLVCMRYQRVEHWPWYVLWNVGAIAVILLLARKQRDGRAWEFAHDWLPAVFFLTAFEEVSFLSLAIRRDWQNPQLIAFESLVFAVPPMLWMRERAAPWLVEFLEFGYFAFYPLYPVVGGLFWAWRERPGFVQAFRRLTDSLSLGYVVCYATYLLFPTQSPANRLGLQQVASAHGGPFQFMVRLDPESRWRPWQRFPQRTHHAGVRGARVRLPVPAASCALAADPDSANVRGRGVRRIPLRQRRCGWSAGRNLCRPGVRATKQT